MFVSKRTYFSLILVLINYYFTNSILEIPLQGVRIKGVPKYPNITMIESGKKIIINKKVIFYEEGNTITNGNLLFLANVKIGSNSQNFNLVLDTGSNLLWVAEKGCSGENTITNYFTPKSSSTCGPKEGPFEIKYGTGNCVGNFYRDEVQYIPNKKFKIKFGVASNADFTVDGGDGIIGLTKSYDDEEKSFIHMLKKSGNTDSLSFSIKFEDNDYFVSDVKGIMYIGEHDDFSKNTTVTCPLVSYRSEIFWGCILSAFSLSGSKSRIESTHSTGIIFDTGTNIIILPLKYLYDIENSLSGFGCYIVNQNRGYILACMKSGDIPDLNFQFNGHTLTIPREYAFYPPSRYSNYVFSFLQFDDSLGVYIMGSVFFFLFHTLFDEEKGEMKFYPLNEGLIDGNGTIKRRPFEDNYDEEGLSGEVIAIIVIISILVVIIIVLVIYFLIRNRKRNNITQGNTRQNPYYNPYHGFN